MQVEDQDEEQDDLARVPRPGALIRATRTKKEISLAELGEMTRLTEAVLMSVEADDYAALGEPVYARGYYRKCADALGLNGEILVDAYEKRSGTGSPIPVIQQRPSIRYREGSGSLKLVGMVLLAVTVLGAAAWWLAQDMGGWSAMVQSPAKPAASATAGPSSNRVETAPQATPVAVVAATPAPVATPVAQATPAPAPQPVTLTLRVAGGQAWADITDAEGQKLLYKLLPAGVQREVRGLPPFDIRLGRADQIRLWMERQPVDISKVIAADLRATFRLRKDGEVEG